MLPFTRANANAPSIGDTGGVKETQRLEGDGVAEGTVSDGR